MNWQDFYSGCDSTECWGPRAWEIIHGAVENFPCGTCRHHGTVLMRAAHDIVNVQKHPNPTSAKYPKDYQEFLTYVKEATPKILGQAPKIRNLNEELKVTA